MAMAISLGGKLALQAAYFVIAARELGPESFGSWAAVVALAAVVAPFASAGSMQLMLRNVARRPQSAAQETSTALGVTTVGALSFSILLAPTYLALVDSAPRLWLIAMVLFTELLLVRLVEVIGIANQALGKMEGTALVTVQLHAARLMGALAYLVCDLTGLSTWIEIQFGCVCLGLLLPAVILVRRIGLRPIDFSMFWAQRRLGLSYAIGLSSQTVYNDMDKVMLASIAGPSAVGLYTAGYRIIDMGFAPMRAMLGAAAPRFFRAGEAGLWPALQLSRRLFPIAFAYSLCVFLLLFFGAPLIVPVLGADYEQAQYLLRVLAILPLVRVGQYLLADALTAADRHGWRVSMQISAALVNVLLNIFLLGEFSWKGATWVSLVTDTLLLAQLSVVAIMLVRVDRRRAAVSHEV